MTLPDGFFDRPFAHRALHGPGRPENSAAAVRAAVAASYGIEIDVQLSADGASMVFHDYALDRLTGETGPVRQRSAAALSEVVLTGGTEGIPTLPEVLEIVGGAVPLLVEIKDQDGALGADVGPLEAAVAAALSGYDGPVAVMSFNPHAVAEMARILPTVPRGLTTCSYPPEDWPMVPEAVRAALRPIPDYDRVGASFISHQASDLGSDAVAAIKFKGGKVCCWTIRSVEAEANARKVADCVTFEGYLA